MQMHECKIVYLSDVPLHQMSYVYGEVFWYTG